MKLSILHSNRPPFSVSKRKKTSTKTKPPEKNPVKAKSKSTSIHVDYNIVFWALIACTLALTIIIRLNFLEIPFERDEGDYALAGKLLLEGGKPYLDFFEQKPPGLFYSYAFVEAIFGKSISGLHVGFLVLSCFSIVFISYALKILFSPVAGAVGGLSFALLSLNPYASGFTVQAEHLLCFFITLSFLLLCLAFEKKKLWLLIPAGASVAWSATIKQNGLFFIIAITLGVLALHLSKGKIDLKKLIKEYLYLAIGGVGMLLVVVILMLANGVWNEFLFWAIEFPRETYVSEIPFSKGMEYLSSYYKRISGFNPWLWYSGIAGLLLILFTRLKWSIKIWIIIFAALSLLSIFPGYRFYGHYWLHFFIGTAIAVSACFHGVHDLGKRWVNEHLSIVIPLLVFLVFATMDLSKHRNYFFAPHGPTLIQNIYGTNPFNETYQFAEYLKSIPGSSSEKLLVLGSEPQLHFQSGMESPTPHTFIAFTAGPHPRAKQWREEYLTMMQKNEAKYAVFVVHPFSWLASTQEAKEFFSQTFRYVQTNYKRIGIADKLDAKNTIYKFGEEALTYKPQSKQYLVLYERL